MNYIKSLVTDFLAFAGIYFVTEMGNRYRLFTRQSALDMSAARFMVALVFIVTLLSFAMYYRPAAKMRAGTYGPLDQEKLKAYIRRSVVIFVIGDLVVLIFSILNGVMVLFGNGGYFSTALVSVTILVYAGLYILDLKYFQPKNVYLKTKSED